jgi:hypothetical protein
MCKLSKKINYELKFRVYQIKNEDPTDMSWTQLQPCLATFLLLYVASTIHVSLSKLGKIEFLIVKDF